MTNRTTSTTQVLRVDRRRGFTLLEILIVIALIAVFTSLFVMNFDVLMRQSAGEAVEGAFWKAVREARVQALVERGPRSLRYDEEKAAFIVEPVREAGVERTIAVDWSEWSVDTTLDVRFQKHLPSSQLTLVQGELVDMRDVPSVQFFPDGTCTPFSLFIKVGSDEQLIDIDPWTGAELLKADES